MLATEIEDFEKNNKWKGELSIAQNIEFGCMAYCWHFWRSQSHQTEPNWQKPSREPNLMKRQHWTSRVYVNRFVDLSYEQSKEIETENWKQQTAKFWLWSSKLNVGIFANENENKSKAPESLGKWKWK